MIGFLLQDTGAVYGAERATIDLARGIARRGEKSVVILIRETRLGLKESALESALRAAGLDVDVVPTEHRLSLALVRGIRETLERRGARILHSVGYKADVHGAMAAKGRMPHVSTVHGWLFRLDLKERFYARVNLQALRHCTRVIALSRFYEDLLKKEGLTVTRIPSGIDLADFPKRPRRAGVFTVGLMGRFSEEKNHGLFLRAAAKVAPAIPDIRFLIAGDGPLREDVDEQIRQLGLQDFTLATGYIARDEFLGQIDCLVLCSRIENLPYSVMEAMACGLPVIATRVGGLPDLVEDGKTGYLVPSDDDAALADRIARLANSPRDVEELGTFGRGKLEQEFTLDRMLSAHGDLYASLR